MRISLLLSASRNEVKRDGRRFDRTAESQVPGWLHPRGLPSAATLSDLGFASATFKAFLPDTHTPLLISLRSSRHPPRALLLYLSRSFPDITRTRSRRITMRNPAFIPPEYNTTSPMWLDANVASYFLYRSVRELLAYGIYDRSER